MLFGNKKKPDKIRIFLDFFQSERLVSGKTFSELHIHYKSVLKRAITMLGAHNIEKFLQLP